MIETETHATVHCDHMRYDSAALKGGSPGCLVASGPYRTSEAARESIQAAGWFVTLHRPHPFTFCPLHRDKARQFWGEAV